MKTKESAVRNDAAGTGSPRPSAGRWLLDGLYQVSFWLACLMLVALLAMVMLGIVGRSLNFYVRGTDAYAGYLMAGSTFLGLAHTLTRGQHVRVDLLWSHLRGTKQRVLERVALGLSALAALGGAVFAIKLVRTSFELGDISSANDATPLWLPQIGMAIGLAVFALACLDAWWTSMRTSALSTPISGTAYAADDGGAARAQPDSMRADHD